MHPLVRFVLDRLPPASELAEVAIVTPTTGAASALRSSVLRHGRALVGAHFVTAPALARIACERQGHPCPADRPDPLEERAVLTRCIERGHGAAAAYARRFPGALRELGRAIREWQSAGQPNDASDAFGREFVAIARDYTRAMRGFATRATLVAAACETLRKGDYRGPSRVLVVARRPARDFDALLTALTTAGARVEEYEPARTPPPATTLRSCKDPEAELRAAASDCLDATGTGTTFADCVVAVPQLADYGFHVRRAFEAEGVPFTTAVESPLRQEPRAAACSHAAWVLFGDTPRRAWMGLLASPLLRTRPLPNEQHRFDTLSRDDHFAGRGERAAEFVRWFKSQLDRDAPRPTAPRLLDDWLRAAEVAERATTTADRVAALERFLGKTLVPPTPGTRDALCADRLHDGLAALCRAAAIHDRPGDGDEFASRIRQLLDERGMPLVGASDLGVHVVEFADALAHPAVHLQLCGLVEGAVPRRTPSNAFLRDGDRESFGLESAEQIRSRERATLDGLCHHGAASVTIRRPRQRSDGSSAAPSVWWPDLGGEFQAEVREPTHPSSRARARVVAGRCPRDLALVRLAIDAADVDALATIAGDRARTLWDSARDLERFEPTSLVRDGDLGRPLAERLAERSLSVSNLRTLGYCAHQFLFKHVFGLRPLPPEPDPCELPRDRLGRRIHSVLERVFEEFRTPILDAARCSDLLDGIAARAEEVLDHELERERAPLQRDFPTLHMLLVGRWRTALREALRADLLQMDEDGSRPVGVEERIQATIPLVTRDGTGIDLTLHGRVDRIDRLASGNLRVVDFKTSAKPQKEVDKQQMLRGLRPQLPAYALMLEANERCVEQAVIRAVRPAPPNGGEVEFEHALEPIDELVAGKFGREFRATLATIGALRRRGAFVATTQSQPCQFCEFRNACRRLHPPSAHRVRTSGIAEVARYHALTDTAVRRALREEGDGA